jgi:hypothetical protein
MGNYEYVNYGWQSESLRVLTGAPTFMNYMSSYNATNIWSQVDTALKRGFNVGVDTSATSLYVCQLVMLTMS